MTAVEPLVDVITGEVIEVALTPGEARALTDRIRQTLHVGHDLIVQAFKGSAWSVLGYATWDAYCAGEFAGARMVRLAPAQTRELATDLRREGLSVPAVASALGISERTVQRHSEQVVTPDTTSPEPVTGIDGKTYQSPALRPQPVVAEPTAPKRRPLPDQFFDAAVDLARSVERVERLTQDDRWTQNAPQVATKHRSDLLRAAEALARVLDRLA